MNETLPPMRTEPMTAEAFLAWAEAREGRLELIAGRVVEDMAPELVRHARLKYRLCAAFDRALVGTDLPCEALIDGPVVKIDDRTVLQPDVIVHCGSPIPGDTMIVPCPVIVAEVLSASSAQRDLTVKLALYARHAAVRHYLVVDPLERLVLHHRRAEGEAFETRVLREGSLTLDPPGLVLDLAILFPADPEAGTAAG